MKVILLTKYDMQGASSRIRASQFIPYLNKSGIEVDSFPLFSNQYLSRLYKSNSRLILKSILSYIKRFKNIFNFRNYDVIWLQKDLFPWLPVFFDFISLPSNIPIVMDIDDAIFHNYDLNPNIVIRKMLGNKISFLMKKASIVTAGNEYIADYAKRVGANRIEIIPSTVDLLKYPIKEQFNEIMNIGWIGTPLTVKYLEPICNLLNEKSKEIDIKLTVIGADLENKYNYDVVIVPWEESTEGIEISRCDMGIMPLDDGPFERGKCGYKLIQYMACGLPVIASPVGINKNIIQEGVNGYLASSPEEWLQAFISLHDDLNLRKVMGRHNRSMVEANFNTEIVAHKLVKLFFSLN